MSDIFDVDDEPVEVANGSDWESGSDSDAPAPKSRRKGRNKQSFKRPQHLAEDDLEGQRPEADETDELLERYLTDEQPPAKRQKQQQQRSPSPLIVSSEDDHDGQQAVLVADAIDEKTRQALEQARRVQQMLAEAQQLAEDMDPDDDIELSQPPQPLLGVAALRQQREAEDLTYDLLEDSDDDGGGGGHLPSSSQQQQGNGAAAAGASGKVDLIFRTQTHGDVTVLVWPDDPLCHAMERFVKHASEQGWGKVHMFHSPDGDKLAGDDTAAGLELESGDVIDVFFST